MDTHSTYLWYNNKILILVWLFNTFTSEEVFMGTTWTEYCKYCTWEYFASNFECLPPLGKALSIHTVCCKIFHGIDKYNKSNIIFKVLTCIQINNSDNGIIKYHSERWYLTHTKRALHSWLIKPYIIGEQNSMF